MKDGVLMRLSKLWFHLRCMVGRQFTEAQIDKALERVIAQTSHERFRWLCWKSPQAKDRAGWQVVVLKMAAGLTGLIDPTEAEMRATPAGRTIPAPKPMRKSIGAAPACAGGTCGRGSRS
jgi:hypothetical protein